MKSAYLPEVGLGLTLWHGMYEMKEDTYLRWRHQDGNLLPTGSELAEREAERAEKLAAKLRELGFNPDQI